MESCFEEVGVVKDVVDNMLLVSMAASNRCGACSICTSGLEKEMRLTVFNNNNFTVGDRVRVQIFGRNLLAASVIVYLIPLADLFVGYFIGFFITSKLGAPSKAGMVAAITGGIFFAASFYLSRFINKRMERAGKHIIKVEKITEE